MALAGSQCCRKDRPVGWTREVGVMTKPNLKWLRSLREWLLFSLDGHRCRRGQGSFPNEVTNSALQTSRGHAHHRQGEWHVPGGVGEPVRFIVTIVDWRGWDW